MNSQLSAYINNGLKTSHGGQSRQSGKSRTITRLSFLVPFFLSSGLYLSLVFSLFSPIPLIYAHLRFGRIVGLLSSIANIAIIWSISGKTNASVFFIFTLVSSWAIAECVKLKLRIEWSVLFTTSLMILVSGLILLGYSYRFGVNPFERLDSFVGSIVNQVVTNAEKYKNSGAIPSQDLDKFLADPEMTKRNIIYELPSVIVIGLLIIVLSNLFLMLRLNISNIRKTLGLKADFFKYWKASDHMVWLAIVGGCGLLFDTPVVFEVSFNFLKILMAIYAIQGLAIANYMFDIWGLKGILRSLGYFLIIAVMLPLLISLGFSDLWINYRAKFKAKSQ